MLQSNVSPNLRIISDFKELSNIIFNIFIIMMRFNIYLIIVKITEVIK